MTPAMLTAYRAPFVSRSELYVLSPEAARRRAGVPREEGRHHAAPDLRAPGHQPRDALPEH
eukprot:10646725-Alexandrium_andersonii.AAC.1